MCAVEEPWHILQSMQFHTGGGCFAGGVLKSLTPKSFFFFFFFGVNLQVLKFGEIAVFPVVTGQEQKFH